LLPGDPPLKIETRARWLIPNEVRRESAPVAQAASIEHWRAVRPNARPRSISATSNCLGMVVCSRRAWVDPCHLHKVFRDDGFRQLKGVAEVEVGDVVVYRDDAGDVSHVSIVAWKNLATDPIHPGDPLTVLSKWGGEGEYMHDMSDVPELLGRPVEFWTDRKGV